MNTILLKDFARLYGEIGRYLEDPGAKDDVRGKVSDFWAEVLAKRPNFPDLNHIQTFRRNDFFGVFGEREFKLSMEQEQKQHDNFHESVLQFTPRQYLEKLEEPLFGAPVIFEKDGVSMSSSWLMNAGQSWRVQQAIDKNLNGKQAISICDIGPGWGALVHQVAQNNEIKFATIVDLRENLALSSTFLFMTMGLEHGLVRAGETEQAREGVMYATIPENLDNLDARYDVIMNTFSLHEMEFETARSYVSWAREHLTEDGIFVSMNAFNKRLAGIKKASQYGFHEFHIRELTPFRKSPRGFFNLIPCELVMARRRPDDPEYSPDHFDALCDLIQLGLDGNIAEAAAAFREGRLSAEQANYLAAMNAFFQCETMSDKLERMTELESFPEQYRVISSFIKGHLLFVKGYMDGVSGGDSAPAYREAVAALDDACVAGLSDFARCNARVFAAGIMKLMGDSDRKTYNAYFNEAREIAPGLADEIETILEKDFDHNRNIIAGRLRFDLESWEANR